MMKERSISRGPVLGVALCAFAVAFASAAAEPLPYAGPESDGVSQEGLDTLKALLEETHTHAAVILHEGKIIAEWYWLGDGPNTTYEAWSTSKSFASTCIGCLIDDGKVGSIEDKVSKYIPSWSEGQKAKVTLAHILDQTSGLEEGETSVFATSKDQIKLALEADILTEPGEVGRYNNAACNVLSAIISSASGKDPEAYMRERVWKRIGMDQTWWRRDAAGNVITYAGIQTTARELARFGLLHLNQGTWKGERILSEEWIEAATHERTRLAIQGFGEGAPYGLLWWLDFGVDEGVPHNFSSLGLFGNNMTVIPELDLVGVRLVGNDREGMPLMMRTPEWVAALAGVVNAAVVTD